MTHRMTTLFLASLPVEVKIRVPNKYTGDIIVTNNDMICDECNISLIRKDFLHCVCTQCGLQVENEAPADTQDYNEESPSNLSQHGYLSLIGKQSKKLSHMNYSMRNTGSRFESKYYKQSRLRDKLSIWVYGLKDTSIPKSILDNVVDIYMNMGLTKRGNQLSAFIASILYFECINAGIPRDITTIAKLADLTISDINWGIRLYQTLNTGKTVLDKPAVEITDHINHYFEKLNLSKYDKYKTFVSDLVHCSQANKIQSSENCMTQSTRLAGAISILCKQLKIKGVSSDIIANAFNISTSTLQRFVIFIARYNKLIPIIEVFKTHNIKMIQKRKSSRTAFNH